MRSHSRRGRTPRASAPGSMGPFTATVQMTPDKVSAPRTGLNRRGEESVLVKKEFVWWVKVLTSSDWAELQRSRSLSSNKDEWYLHTYMDSVMFFSQRIIVASKFRVFCLAYILYIYMSICIGIYTYIEVFLFSFSLYIKIFFACQAKPRGHCWIIQLPPQVKYLQFVESMTQRGVHLRWPYDLQPGGDATFRSACNKPTRGGRGWQQYTLCSPWKVWITRLVSKVLSITLLGTLVAVSVSTVCVFTLCQRRGSHVICT